MRVAFVTLVDLSGTAGQNVYSRQVGAALGRQSDVELTLVCPEPTTALPSPVTESVAEVQFLPRKQSRSLRWHARIQASLVTALRASRPRSLDALVSTLRPSLVVPPLVARTYSIPYRLIIEGNITAETYDLISAPFIRTVSDAVARLNFAMSQRTYAVNEEIRSWVESLWCGGPVDVLPHGVDATALSAAAGTEVPEEIPQEEFVVGYVGSFESYHCLEPLLRAAARLDSEGEPVHLLLVGDGPEHDRIVALSRDLGLDAHTTVPGFVDPSRVGMYLSHADVCYGVIDPDRTGSPMKVYEYLAASRPVVATASEELSFIAEYGAGELLEEVTPEAIAATIDRLRALEESEWATMGDAGRDYICERDQSWDDIARQLLEGLPE